MRSLEAAEIEAYADVIDPGLAARVRIQRVPLLPPRASGMTIDRFVLLLDDDDRAGTSELMAHELVHVRQWADHGFFGFLRRYLGDYVRGLWTHKRHRKAYLEIPFEAEARALAKRWSTDPRNGRM